MVKMMFLMPKNYWLLGATIIFWSMPFMPLWANEPTEPDRLTENKIEYADNDYIVQLTDDGDFPIISGLMAQRLRPLSSKQLSRTALDNAASRRWRVQATNSTPAAALINILQQNPRVKQIERSLIRRLTVTPNDSDFASQWHHTATNGINSEAAWDRQTGSSQIVIAVIDTGVDTDHPDLAANLWTNSAEIANNGIDDDANGYVDDTVGYDFVGSDTDPNPTPEGSYSSSVVVHGTHVAGIAAAVTNNTTGVSGINWRAKIMAVRVCTDSGSCSDSYISSGIYYAVDNGADVINLSLGGIGYSTSQNEAIQYAINHGVVVVAAAGNDTTNINSSPFYPICYNNVIGVASTDNQRQASSFTNYGSNCVDLSAPGSSIYSTFYTNDSSHGLTSDYGTLSGTSMATPMITGIVSLMLSQQSTLTVSQVTNALQLSAVNIGLSADYGSGLADAAGAVIWSDCVVIGAILTSPVTYYIDSDGDGFGSTATSLLTCAPPTNYVSNNTDINDSDYDNDGVSTSADCNDRDAAIAVNQTYFVDTDADGLGDPTSSGLFCSLTAPSGYAANTLDQNDNDFDNDSVAATADCNDADALIAVNQTYYADDDADTLGNPLKTVSICSLTSTTGYVANDSDTDDTIPNYGVEIDDDRVDNNGNGEIDEINVGSHPYFGALDANSVTRNNSIEHVTGTAAGAIKVTYADHSVYLFSVFDVTSQKRTPVYLYENSLYAVALHPQGKRLILFNLLDGSIVARTSLAKQSYLQQGLRFFDLLDNGTMEAVVTLKQNQNIRLVMVTVNPTAGTLKLRSALSWRGQTVAPDRTGVKPRLIKLRNGQGKIIKQFSINRRYQLAT